MKDMVQLDTEFNNLSDCDDSTEVLIKKYNNRNYRKNDDIMAMQAVLCILLVLSFLVVNISEPELAKSLFSYVKNMSENRDEVIPNLIDVVISFCSEL